MLVFTQQGPFGLFLAIWDAKMMAAAGKMETIIQLFFIE